MMGYKGGGWGTREVDGVQGRWMGYKGGGWGTREVDGVQGRWMGYKGGGWGTREVDAGNSNLLVDFMKKFL